MGLTPFQIEIWTKYIVAMCIMSARFIVRLRTMGWRRLDISDAFCILASVLYTIVEVCNYILTLPTIRSNIQYSTSTALLIPEVEAPSIVRGSKIILLLWTSYICMIFCFKGVLLGIFHRICRGAVLQEWAVYITTIIVIVSWMISIIASFAFCTPIRRFWQVKPWPGPYCTSRPQNYYFAEALNIFTDLLVALIPIPIIVRLQVPLGRKIILAFLFCSGLLIIICAIINTYYSLSNKKSLEIAQEWTSREGFVLMVIVSAPGLSPILRRIACLGSQRQPRRVSAAWPNNQAVVSDKSFRNFHCLRHVHHRQSATASTTMGTDSTMSNHRQGDVNIMCLS